MKAFRKNRLGFIEEINTDSSFIAKGWSRTKEAANKKKAPNN